MSPLIEVLEHWRRSRATSTHPITDGVCDPEALSVGGAVDPSLLGLTAPPNPPHPWIVPAAASFLLRTS